MLIRFTAPALVFDANGELVTSVDVHRQFDGTSYDEAAFTDFLGGPKGETELALLLDHGGYLRFLFIDSESRLYAVTDFRASRRLNVSELELLTNYTKGQWSDGIGENFVSESSRRYGYSLQPETDGFEAVQIDDGVPSVGNKAAAIFRAIDADDLEAVVAAIPGCEDLNATLAGFAPLGWAISREHPDIAVELAKHCGVSVRNLMGMSLLHSIALSRMNDEDACRVATAVINAGAGVDVQDDFGNTAAAYAKTRDKPRLRDLLMAVGLPT
jgi:hypothetical protein